MGYFDASSRVLYSSDCFGAILDRFPAGVVTQEVAAIMTAGNDPVDRAAAEEALIGLVADGRASREPLGDDALWRAVRVPAAVG